MLILHYNTVLPFKCCLSRAYPYTGRILTMIAEQGKWLLFNSLRQVFILLTRKCMFIGISPYPLHLILWVAKVRDIVNAVAGICYLFIILLSLELPHVNNHCPLLCCQAFLGRRSLYGLKAVSPYQIGGCCPRAKR